jgi:hypothetical protein
MMTKKKKKREKKKKTKKKTKKKKTKKKNWVKGMTKFEQKKPENLTGRWKIVKLSPRKMVCESWVKCVEKWTFPKLFSFLHRREKSQLKDHFSKFNITNILLFLWHLGCNTATVVNNVNLLPSCSLVWQELFSFDLFFYFPLRQCCRLPCLAIFLAKERARVECEGHPLVKILEPNLYLCQLKVITLGLIERLTKNADPVWTREKARRKKNSGVYQLGIEMKPGFPYTSDSQPGVRVPLMGVGERPSGGTREKIV